MTAAGKSAVDLEALEALLAKATPGEWEASGDDPYETIGPGGKVISYPPGPIRNVRVKGSDAHVSFPASTGAIASLDDSEYIENPNAAEDAACIAALHNAASALIAELRELRTVMRAIAEVRCTAGWCCGKTCFDDHGRERCPTDGGIIVTCGPCRARQALASVEE